MTYTLTPEQLADLQADLGIDDSETVFDDAALNRLFDRAAGNYDVTIVLALRQLRASAIKLHNYVAGNTSESREQVFKHLGDVLAERERNAGMYGGGALYAGSIALGLDAVEDDCL